MFASFARRGDAVSRLSSTVNGLKRAGADALAAIGIRILGRVIGSDLSTLIDTVSAAASPSGSGKSPSAADAEFAASLFASLMNQRDMAEAVVAAGGLSRLVSLLASTSLSPPCISSLCTALRYVIVVCLSPSLHTSRALAVHGDIHL